MIILALDPSGSFKYGSGITGYCLLDSETKEIIVLGNVKAKNFKTREDYFKAHLDIVLEKKPDILVVENFVLYKESAKSFYNQELETSELIGFITNSIPKEIKVFRQKAQLIKTAFKSNKVFLAVVNQKVDQLEIRTNKVDSVQFFCRNIRISNHIADSIRHAFYFINSKEYERKKQ